MRILKLIFSAAIFFAIVAILGFFVSREALLYWGSIKIKDSLRTLVLSQNRGSYASQCRKLGSDNSGGGQVDSYQIRFLSSKEFILEAVCDQFSYDPILIEKASLPEFVEKVPGTSGFILGEKQNGVEIQVFADEITKISEIIKFDLTSFIKKRFLVAQGGLIISEEKQDYLDPGPITSCPGYGYQCCENISELGVGDRITGLIDCEKNCFSSCSTRPIILSFNINPLLDPRARSLTVGSGEIVEFTFVADQGDATTVNGVLDFGDGTKLPVSGLAGQVSHTYSCSRASCNYIVELTLEDNWGIESASTSISKIQITVNN